MSLPSVLLPFKSLLSIIEPRNTLDVDWKNRLPLLLAVFLLILESFDGGSRCVLLSTVVVVALLFDCGGDLGTASNSAVVSLLLCSKFKADNKFRNRGRCKRFWFVGCWWCVDAVVDGGILVASSVAASSLFRRPGLDGSGCCCDCPFGIHNVSIFGYDTILASSSTCVYFTANY